ncbi:hypothetical protein [Pelagibius sp.]|uniref:hypothetical protein n=1 Tax=Pelagibius sp. TaxID=1931238 RepID=UPI002631F27E|nr:hypothetical protein [Pelagibius sp.]
MQDLTPKPKTRRDLDALVCLLQGYEHYGSVSTPPDCLDRLDTAPIGRRRSNA